MLAGRAEGGGVRETWGKQKKVPSARFPDAGWTRLVEFWSCLPVRAEALRARAARPRVGKDISGVTVKLWNGFLFLNVRVICSFS